MTEKLFVMELIPSGVFNDLPIELNVWCTRLSEILDMSLSLILSSNAVENPIPQSESRL